MYKLSDSSRTSRIFLALVAFTLLYSCSAIESDKPNSNSATSEVSKPVTNGKIDRSLSDNTQNNKENNTSLVAKKAIDAVKQAELQTWQWPNETTEELQPHLTAETLDLKRPLVQSFIRKLVEEHGFDKNTVIQYLAQAKNKPSILQAISRPAEKSKEWFEYRPIFLTEKRISRGKNFMRENANALQAAESKYGVPAEIIAAIIGVETHYGRITGKYNVLDSLVTLGFNYPPRAQFFRRELEQFFLLSREESFTPNEVLGSYAGAMGFGQFISSSYRNFSVDGNQDGIRDLWNWTDAIHSVANYFNIHNWKTGEQVLTNATLEPDCAKQPTELPASKVSIDQHTIGSLKKHGCGINFTTPLNNTNPAMFLIMQQENSTDYLIGFNNFYAITRYNRSPMYARAVYELSLALIK